MADFYYTGAGRDQTLEMMRDRFRSNPGLVLLVDEIGSGRTTFLHALINAFPADESDGCLLAENSIRLETEEQLFQTLAAGFGLEYKSVEILEELKDRVDHFIRARLQDGHTVFILVDGAIRHSQEVITWLLNLACHHAGLNLLLVVTKDELPDALEHFQLQSLAIDRVALGSLQPEEAVDFIRCYLQHHGVTKQWTPDVETVVALMNKTQGNLALLAYEAQKILPQYILFKEKALEFPRGHLMALAVVVGLTVLVFFYYPEPTGQQASESVLLGSSAASQEATGDDPVPETETSATDDSTPEESDDSSVSDKTIDPLEVEAATQTEGTLSPPQTPVEVPVSAAVQVPHPVGSPFTRDEQALLDQPAENFTLQIANLLTEKKAEVLMAQWTADEQPLLHYYRRKYGSKISYIVVYGNYPNKQAALGAVHVSHETLGKFMPWPRRLGEIQQELKHRLP